MRTHYFKVKGSEFDGVGAWDSNLKPRERILAEVRLESP
jgi:hypothetical protein